MPTTFVHGLLPSACITVMRRVLPPLTRREWRHFAIVAFFIGNAPDLDLIPGILYPQIWNDVHRELGHNIFAILLWTYLGSLALPKFVSKQLSKRQAWQLSTFFVLSHILLDGMSVLDASGLKGGVPLLWPFLKWQWHSPLKIFPNIQYEESMHPMMARILAIDFWKRGIFIEFGYSLLIVALWLATWTALQHAPRLFSFRRIRSAGKRVPQSASPFAQSSPKYIPELPSPPHPDGNPSHTYIDS